MNERAPSRPARRPGGGPSRGRRKPKPVPPAQVWPPLWARLPATIEDIEAGRRPRAANS